MHFAQYAEAQLGRRELIYTQRWQMVSESLNDIITFQEKKYGGPHLTDVN